MQGNLDGTSLDFCSLTRITGMGAKNNFQMDSNRLNGIITWIAGPYLVFYDIQEDKQVSFLKNPNNKILSCVAFSKNGELLATGEGNCKNGEICVYNFSYEKGIETHSLYCSLKNHKFGIEKIRFFAKDNYLISIGNKFDKTINIFNLLNQTLIYTTHYKRSIIGFDINDNFMVLSGDKFIKIYSFKELIDSDRSGNISNKKSGISKSVIDLSKLKDNTFIAAQIVENAGASGDTTKIYFLTLESFLVEMRATMNSLSRWVGIKGNKGFSLCAFGNVLACGCADGIIRLFSTELQHLCTFPKPPPLCKENIDSANPQVNVQIQTKDEFPDIAIIAYSNLFHKLITIYSNKIYFCWDINDLNKLIIYRSSIFHSGSILCMDYDVSPEDNMLKIATSSDDRTVIYWNMKLNEFINSGSTASVPHISYSKHIRHIFHFGKNNSHFKLSRKDFLENKNNELPDDENQQDEITSLNSVRFSPDKKFLAIGDNLGNVYIVSLTSFKMVQTIPACGDIINSIDMISDINSGRSYLAFGSSDNILSVIDISKGLDKDLDLYNEEKNIVEKLENPVISVQFCIDKRKDIKIVTAESDSKITFFIVLKHNLQKVESYVHAGHNTYCLSYCPGNNRMISGHNGQIKIWKTSRCVVHKHFQVCKGDKLLDNFRIAIDKKGIMFATSNNDKNIRVRAFHDGRLIVKIPTAESISCLAFAMDNNYLIATSVEGYIYFYKISHEYIDKLNLVNSNGESEKLKRKLELLKKLVENDITLSKNEQIKFLLEKLEKSEEISRKEWEVLDSIAPKTKIKKEVPLEEKIQLKEDKPNNNDDNENTNINENGDFVMNHMSPQNENEMKCLPRSIIFERGLTGGVNELGRSVSHGGNNNFNPNRVSISSAMLEKKHKVNNKPNAQINNNNIQNGKEDITNTNDILEDVKIENDNKEHDDVNINNDNDKAHKININYEKGKSNKPFEMQKFSQKENQIDKTNEEIKNIQNCVRDANLYVNKIIESCPLSDSSKLNHNKNLTQEPKTNLNNEEPLDIKDINIDNFDKEHDNENKRQNDVKDFNKQNVNMNINNVYEKELPIKEDIIRSEEYSLYPTPYQEPSSFQFDAISQMQIIGNSQQDKRSIFRNSNMYITQSNFDIASSCRKLTHLIESNTAWDIIQHKKQIKLIKENIIQFQINSGETPIQKLKDSLDKFDISKVNTTSELEEIESKLENVLNQIRVRLGNESKDPVMEKMLEKYSLLLLDKLDKMGK